MPGFVVTADGERLLWGRTKVEEMFALLADGERRRYDGRGNCLSVAGPDS